MVLWLFNEIENGNQLNLTPNQLPKDCNRITEICEIKDLYQFLLSRADLDAEKKKLNNDNHNDNDNKSNSVLYENSVFEWIVFSFF